MATTLLDPSDGSASMATKILTAHHGFRRDLTCFATALTTFDRDRTAALAEEWMHFRTVLHHHHVVEDTGLFPDLRANQPTVVATVDELEQQHRAIDPLLERGDRLFADLATNVVEAREVIVALIELLAVHLDLEEHIAIPFLRAAKQFPSLPEDALATLADGFAWSTAGLASDVIAQVDALLPAGLVARLPAARQRFAERCVRVWGHVHAGRSATSAPA